MRLARTAFAVLALSLPATLVCAEDPFVSIPSGTTQTLVLQGDGSYSARVGLVTRDAGPPLGGLVFKVFEVQHKESRSTELLSRFAVSPKAASATQGDALVIDVRPNATELLPGNYVLTLHVLPATGGGKAQSLALTVAKPAASLSVGSSVLVERIDGWWQVAPRTVKGKVRLTEDSRVANLSGLTFATDFEPKPNTPAPGGHVVVCPKTSALAAGQSFECEASLQGDFPYGTHTGKITVRSPQLASPVTMNLTVLSRRNPCWLICLAAAGALLGYLVRVHLKRRKEIAEADIHASSAREKLGVARDRIEEPDVREKIDKEIATLESLVRTRKAADIVAAATAALTNLQAIEQEFNTRRAAFEPEINKLNALLAKVFILPPPVESKFELVAALAERVVAAFRRNHLTAAREHLDKLSRGTLLEVVKQSIAWRQSFANYLSTLDDNHAPLSDEARKNLHNQAERARSLPANPYPTNADVSTTDTELELAHGAYNGGKEFIKQLSSALQGFLDRAQELLAKVEVDPNSWQAIESATGRLRQNLDSAMDAELDQRATEAKAELLTLATAWLDWLVSRLAPEDRDSIEQHLAAGRWDTGIVEAAKAIRSRSPADDAEGTFEGADVTLLEDSELTLRTEDAMRPVDLAQRPGLTTSRLAPFTLTGTERERHALRLKTAWIEFAQTVLVGVLFVAGVYALNADTWIGTLKDMFTIGMLAFAVDLSAEGVLAALKK